MKTSFFDTDNLQKDTHVVTLAVARQIMNSYLPMVKRSNFVINALTDPTVMIEYNVMCMVHRDVNIEKLSLEMAANALAPLVRDNPNFSNEIKELAIFLTENKLENFWLSFAEKSDLFRDLIKKRNDYVNSVPHHRQTIQESVDERNKIAIQILDYLKTYPITKISIEDNLNMFLSDTVKDIIETLALHQRIFENTQGFVNQCEVMIIPTKIGVGALKERQAGQDKEDGPATQKVSHGGITHG